MRRRILPVKRIGLGLFAFLLLGAGHMRADQTTVAVQEALKEQGFYYGDATGKKDADTTAAIRRYQIRNGLQITGEIDAETLRSLGVGGSAARATPAPRPAAPPAENSPEDENDPGQSAEIPSQEEAPVNPALQPPGRSYQGPGRVEPRPEVGRVFEGTPYEMAPPDLQRHVIVGAQVLLARYGYYRSGIDGEFGPGTVAAVRIFQNRAGLVPDGRLNMETLSALGLLPGQHGRGITPWQRRRLLPRPVYRGQWIPE
jgi:peptidoglycan hydrolase-like protein with peptidoglycan-binding domain